MKRLTTLLACLVLSAAACSGDTSDLDKTPPGCTHAEASPHDQHCENSASVAGTGNECSADVACPMGEECLIVTNCGATRCHGNVCMPKMCTDNAQCDGWICMAGVCTDPGACTENADCPESFTCDEPAMRCVPVQSCDMSSDCRPDQRCIQDICDQPCNMPNDCGFGSLCDINSGECQQVCNTDGVCPMGTICEMFRCIPAECTVDGDCPNTDFECVGEEDGHGRCVEVFACDAPGGCPQGTVCNRMTNRCEPLPECVSDRDCTGAAYCDDGYCQPSLDCRNTPCEAGYDCVGGICVPEMCRGDADCTAPERCIAGACSTPPAPTAITQVRILTPAGHVRPGTTYRFIAVALDQTGAVVPGISFVWASSVEPVAAIDSTGLATGGSSPGVTIITAAVNNGTSNIVSPGVELVNLGELPMGAVRVLVVGASGGNAIGGAAVDVTGDFGSMTATTDLDGVAVFNGIPMGDSFSVTAGQSSYDFVSVLGVDARDLLIALPPVSKPSQSGGVKGNVDFSSVTAEGDLSISINGASFASPLVTFEPAGLFGGDQFTVTLRDPGGGGMIDVPVGAGVTLSVVIFGQTIDIKEMYYARANTGIRASWGFGGRIGLGIFQPGGGGDLGNLIGTILPYLQRFDHAVRPVVDIVALPTVIDTGDIDGDGDMTEMVPNYAQFPSVNLAPDTSQSLRYNIAVDNLPFVSGGNANTLLVVGGMLLPSVGFVPLGLDGTQDMAGNGIVDPFTTKIAPAHGGLEIGEYAVLATAVRLDPGALPGPGSTRLVVGSRLPEDVDLSDGWLDSPVDARWDVMARAVELPAVPNADLYRVAFSSDDGTWHLYIPAPSPAEPSVGIPLVPAGLIDRTGTTTVSVDAIDLAAGASNSTIFELSSGGVVALDRATRGFARSRVAP